jgi:transposase
MSMKRVYLAIDAHARHCVLGSMNTRGEFLGTRTFATCETELIRHIEAIDARTKIVAIEEGPLAFWIAHTLRPSVSDIVISDPRENSLISRNAMKGDKVDAKNLCRLLRLGELKRVYHPEHDHRAVFKAAVQHYIDLRSQQSSVKQKIKAKYRTWGVPDVHGTCLYHPEKVSEHVNKIALPAIRNQLRRLYSVLGVTLDMQISALKEARRLAQSYPEIKEFTKVPGVGIIGALTFDAYIHTPHRFARKSQLWRYCKLAVTDRSSDGKPLAYKRLDRAGNGELKAMSYRAFLGALRKKDDNEVRQFYTASLQRTHNHTRARLNTQRKILSVLHGIWRRKEVYQPELFLGSH